VPLDTARHFPFRYGVIQANAPRESGVYALFRGSEALYVNEADNIYIDLLHHLDHPALVTEAPTSFAFEVCGADRRRERVTQFVFRRHPAHTERTDLKAQEG
jgi:hypothetical protein